MKWNFPTNNNGDINGISNAGIEMFQGAPLRSLAREMCQNSLDASINSKPVRIEFEQFYIDTKDIPGFEELKNVFDLSNEFWSVQKSTKAKDFYERAIKISDMQNISVLRISDFNTKGLEGSDGEYNTPWCNLTKSSGISDKSGSTGGSFGIGKYAPFACSDFRTIFYNTIAIDGKEAFQGISRLASFKNNNGEITTGVGYYGSRHNKPVNYQYSLGTYKRSFNETGTDIFVLAFKYNDWKEEIILSILDGFLYAIFNEKLEVYINKEIIINKKTLPSIIDEYIGESTNTIKEYYDVLTSQDTIWKTTNFKNKGTISLGLIVKEVETRRSVAMIRKTGMKIFDKTGINGLIQFSGVMIFEGEEINEYLIRMENPEHTKWEPFRVRGNEKAAKNFIRDLTIFIKESLNEILKSQHGEEFDPMIGDLLPLENVESGNNSQRREILSDHINKIEIKERKIMISKKKLYDNSPFSLENTKNDFINIDTTKKLPEHLNEKILGKKKSHSAQVENSQGDYKGIKSSRIRIKPNKIRIICTDRENGKYSISFTSSCDAKKCSLDIFLIAETERYSINLSEVRGLGYVNSAYFEDNCIKGFNLEKDRPARFIIKINNYDYCALEVNAYGNKV